MDIRRPQGRELVQALASAAGPRGGVLLTHILHPGGVTVEEADHMSATRLYQNNSRVHFDALATRDSAVGQRLVYGGHVISLCHALSAYFSDRGRPFQAYRGRQIGAAVDALGKHASPGLNVAQSSTISLKPPPGRAAMAAVLV